MSNRLDDITAALEAGDKERAIALISAYQPAKKKRARRPEQHPNSLQNLGRAPDTGTPKIKLSVLLYTEDFATLERIASSRKSMGYWVRQSLHYVAAQIRSGKIQPSDLERPTSKDADRQTYAKCNKLLPEQV